MTRSFARRSVALAFAGAAAIPLAIGNGTAQAAPAPDIPLAPVAVTAATNGLISYWNGDSTVFVANPDGSNPRAVGTPAFSAPAWAPDGSRFAYSSDFGIKTRRFDGSGLVQASGNAGFSPAWSQGGSLVFYEQGGRLHFVTATGSFESGPLFDPGPNCTDSHPTLAPSGTLVFDRVCSGDANLFQFVPGTGEPTQLIANASVPAFSQDGTKLAYTSFNGSGVSEVWTANADGGSPELLITSATGAAWAPDGTAVAYLGLETGTPTLKTINVATKQVTSLGVRAGQVSWQPVRRNFVDRVWGQDHIDTAVAASQFNYADLSDPNDPRPAAKAVVLSRDDTFLDALVGSAFAANQSAPLLITPRAALDVRVEDEIDRVLGGSGTVYLLGGELALPRAIADRLTSLGYTVDRIAGPNHFATAIAINNRITTTPHTTIVATGINFQDALAAGAAAGANPGTTIVLTDGAQMPAVSRDYLNALNPDFTAPGGTAIVTAGGPGDTALLNAYQSGQLPSWPNEIEYFPLNGATGQDTAVMVADAFFGGSNIAAVATNQTWMDALAGGAMIGVNYGPLLITEPNRLNPGVRDYLRRNSGNIWAGVLLGGPAALPTALKTPIGDAIGLPGQWDTNPDQAGIAATANAPRPNGAKPAHAKPGVQANPTSITR